MKSQLIHVIAGTLAIFATSMAEAQQFGPLPPGQDQAAAEAAPTSSALVASTSRTDGVNGDIADRIAKELNADTSLQGSKLTVAPDADTITLTGVTKTRDQATKANEVATGIAGELRVINAIRPEDS